jgi:hypothetical protein
MIFMVKNVIALMFLVAIVVGNSAYAITIVDQVGGGDYTDLQTALNQVASGEIIHVRGGSFDPIIITKPVTIIGSPAPVINVGPPQAGIQPAVITLAGPGSGAVILANIVVGGILDGFISSRVNPAINGSGFSELLISRSIIQAPYWQHSSLSGTATGGRAIKVTVSEITISHSTISASASDTNSCYGYGQAGVEAIYAPGATLTLLDSTVHGGDGSIVCDYFGPPAPSACPCAGLGGEGGDAINVGTLYQTDSTIIGGFGGDVFYYDDHFQTVDFGQQPHGHSLANGTTEIGLPSITLTSDAPHIGAPFTLSYPLVTVPLSLTASLGVGQPLLFPGFGYVMLNFLNWFVLGSLPLGSTSFVLPIPNDAALIGQKLVFHTFGANFVSRPVIEVIFP